MAPIWWANSSPLSLLTCRRSDKSVLLPTTHKAMGDEQVKNGSENYECFHSLQWYATIKGLDSQKNIMVIISWKSSVHHYRILVSRQVLSSISTYVKKCLDCLQVTRIRLVDNEPQAQSRLRQRISDGNIFGGYHSYPLRRQNSSAQVDTTRCTAYKSGSRMDSYIILCLFLQLDRDIF